MTEYAYRPTADPREVESMTEDGWELVMGEERVAYGMRVSWLLRRPREKPELVAVKEQLREALGRLEDAEADRERRAATTKTHVEDDVRTLESVVKILAGPEVFSEEQSRAISRVRLVIENLEARLSEKKDGKG